MASSPLIQGIMAEKGMLGEPGQCAMRGTCGSKGWFGQPLPCPYDGPPVEPDSLEDRNLLVSVCGGQYSQGPVCCTNDQVETLRDRFGQVESLISSCPACRNNFRNLFCSLTCSPDQAEFINVTATQHLPSTDKDAVKSLMFHIGEDYATGFYESCKDVKVAAANDFAMTFIGGGARNATSLLKFLGDEKDLGSPFQIDFTYEPELGFKTYDPPVRHCYDGDLLSRCTCTDCEDVCTALPPVPAPGDTPTCHVGVISCLSFFLIITYGLAVVGFLFGYIVELSLRKRREKSYERVALAADSASENPLSPRAHSRTLVGASALAHADGEDSLGGLSGESRRLGRGATLLDPMETLQPRQYRVNTVLRQWFYRLGLFCATYPWFTFAIVFALIGLLNLGWKQFAVEKDPVRLWVGPNSESKLQKEFFDQNFGPFYRTEQVFLTDANHPEASALTWDRLDWWFDVEADISELRSFPNNYTLQDVCFSPAGPGTPCVVQSVSGWFGGSLDDYDEESWKGRLKECASAPGNCLPEYRQPLGPQYVLGGAPESEKDQDRDWLSSKAFVATYVVSDSLDLEVQAKAMEWEEALRNYFLSLQERAPLEAGLRIAFSTGVSLEEELNKSTNVDTRIVVLSYLAMFVYVALTLGSNAAGPSEDGVITSLTRWVNNFPRLFSKSSLSTTLSIDSRDNPTIFPRLPRKLFVNSKFTLGLFAIGLVLLSISSSVGLFSALGVKVTLIIAEVIPFLVLAVGVDNVFILVHELDRQNSLHSPGATAQQAIDPVSPVQRRRDTFSSNHESGDAVSVPLHLSPEERVARTLSKMGPSILLSSVTETTAFALGALVPMPAVRNFALYAAGSVFLNAILQVTVLISALTIDLHRVEASRADCFPCLRLPARIALPENNQAPATSRLSLFVRRYYATYLIKSAIKRIVLLTFSGIFVASVISMQYIDFGLDQRLALPSDSYLIDYFNDMDSYYEVGPPVFFVATDVDVTSRESQKHICGGFTTCDDFSLANILEAERKRPESSFISQPTASWIDGFLHWLDPLLESCCRVRKNDPDTFCNPRDSDNRCQPCFADRTPAWNITMEGLPEGPEFTRYLKQWLISPTDEECPLGGQAAYSSAISLQADGHVAASHFRTFHSPLKKQSDFIQAFDAAHRIADSITAQTGAKVFPYSIFYVFFDQYAHIVAITQEVLGLGLGSVLVITALFLGSWRTGSIVTGVVALTVVSVMGVMGLWGISLNALSLVNLVISLGIAVEFCSHIARAFMGAGTGMPVDQFSMQKERDERVWAALVDVGPSVLSGITFTKLIGISVLAMTHSKLLEVYYFRMWLSLIIFGALHGLILLPVLLSLAGGPGYAIEDADEEWMSSTIRRHDYEYTPFLTDDSSIRSD